MSKRILCTAGFLVCAIPSFASVAPVCPVGTLQDYVNLGSTGCTVGGVLFSNFTVEPVPSGELPLDPNLNALSVHLETPFLEGVGIAFENTGALEPAGPGQVRDLLLRFNIEALSTLSTNEATTAVSSNSAFGIDSSTLDLCAGGSFTDGTPSGCSGNFAMVGANTSNPPTSRFGSTTFPETKSLDAFFDLREDGGATGGALADFSDFTVIPTPEPSMVPMLVVGLGALVLYVERRRWSGARS
jgi:hypothetical protein